MFGLKGSHEEQIGVKTSFKTCRQLSYMEACKMCHLMTSNEISHEINQIFTYREQTFIQSTLEKT